MRGAGLGGGGMRWWGCRGRVVLVGWSSGMRGGVIFSCVSE